MRDCRCRMYSAAWAVIKDPHYLPYSRTHLRSHSWIPARRASRKRVQARPVDQGVRWKSRHRTAAACQASVNRRGVRTPGHPGHHRLEDTTGKGKAEGAQLTRSTVTPWPMRSGSDRCVNHALLPQRSMRVELIHSASPPRSGTRASGEHCPNNREEALPCLTRR
jgi:hypothetical protein